MVWLEMPGGAHWAVGVPWSFHMSRRLAVVSLCCCMGRLPLTLAFTTTDMMATKMWFDQFLFNNTLVTTNRDGRQVITVSEAKAREHGLAEWPPTVWPTLCVLGIGGTTADFIGNVILVFPDLEVAVLEAPAHEQEAFRKLLPKAENLVFHSLADFSPARGEERKRCHAVHWSIDTPRFSFHRYEDLFTSYEYVLGMSNAEGCVDGELDAGNEYYCSHIAASLHHNWCGRVTDGKAEFNGHLVEVSDVKAVECGDKVCMCFGTSYALYDVQFVDICMNEGMERFPAQWGQDRFIFENIFHADDRRGKGVYVDIGASHPVILSNTAFFDFCLDWSGLCVEPNPWARPALEGLRSCTVISACAWANETQMTISGTDELVSLSPYAAANSENWMNSQNRVAEVTCLPLERILEAWLPRRESWGEGDAAPIIDLLSIDAEGSEVEILRHFPFQAWDIRTIVVETSRQTSTAVDALLLTQGFVKLAVLGKDGVYVNQEVLSQLPKTGVRLPEEIAWHEPGTESTTTDYKRFQRFFGVDGDLDADVGDKRGD